MAMAQQLRQFLERQGIAYDLVEHPPTESASRTAQAAHIPGPRVLKSVVIRRPGGYLLAVVPSTHRIELGLLEDILKSPVKLASEEEIAELFDDCERGAVPPVGAAYNLPVIMEEDAAEGDDVYFEAGDHRTLVRVAAEDFHKLMRDVTLARFARHV